MKTKKFALMAFCTISLLNVGAQKLQWEKTLPIGKGDYSIHPDHSDDGKFFLSSKNEIIHFDENGEILDKQPGKNCYRPNFSSINDRAVVLTSGNAWGMDLTVFEKDQKPRKLIKLYPKKYNVKPIATRNIGGKLITLLRPWYSDLNFIIVGQDFKIDTATVSFPKTEVIKSFEAKTYNSVDCTVGEWLEVDFDPSNNTSLLYHSEILNGVAYPNYYEFDYNNLSIRKLEERDKIVIDGDDKLYKEFALAYKNSSGEKELLVLSIVGVVKYKGILKDLPRLDDAKLYISKYSKTGALLSNGFMPLSNFYTNVAQVGMSDAVMQIDFQMEYEPYDHHYILQDKYYFDEDFKFLYVKNPQTSEEEAAVNVSGFKPLNKYLSVITKSRSQGLSEGMMYGDGYVILLYRQNANSDLTLARYATK